MIFFKILLVIVVFVVLFEFLTRDYVNPYKLIMIFGKKGSGKTTTLTKIALDNIRKGIKVYSTVDIPGTYKFDVSEIGYKTFEPYSVVLIDEVGMVYDNRNFKNFKPEVRDFFKLQRQYKLTVYLFSQTFDIDLKLRNLTDEMYLLTNFCRVFSFQRRIIKTITIKQCADGTSTLADNYSFDLPFNGGWKFVFIPRYVAYFKSFNPKQLAYIDGRYYQMNDIQREYLSTRKWLRDQFRIVFLKLWHRVRHFNTLLKNRVLRKK